jgi:hypothetical protein
MLVRFAIATWLAIGLSCAASSRVVDADPSNYLDRVRALAPGDTLQLAAGTYRGTPATPGLPVYNLHGTADAPIVISGPASGPRAIFLGAANHNTVRIANASYVTIRHLDIDGQDRGGDGVNGQGTSHHITLEDLAIRGVGDDQGTVGISTNRAPAWHWTIRRCTITGAGTGMYLGNSDGRNPFVAGIIEHNLVRDTIGYNLQVKHQLPWPDHVDLPRARTTTIIRHNVFSKRVNGARGVMARPAVLVGDVPERGPGSTNGYEIYGNYFFQNPTEALLQAEGNVAIYANVLVNDYGSGIAIQRHNGHVREVRVFGNTIVASGTGVSVVVEPGPDERQVVGNLVYAGVPVMAPHQEANLLGSYDDALRELVRARADDGRVDVRPRRGTGTGPRLDMRETTSFTDADRDFDGRLRDWRTRGAYASANAAPRWLPQLAIKP